MSEMALFQIIPNIKGPKKQTQVEIVVISYWY